ARTAGEEVLEERHGRGLPESLRIAELPAQQHGQAASQREVALVAVAKPVELQIAERYLGGYVVQEPLVGEDRAVAGIVGKARTELDGVELVRSLLGEELLTHGRRVEPAALQRVVLVGGAEVYRIILV